MCDRHLWLPNRTPFLFGVEMGSAESSIAQPLLKGRGGPMTSPQEGSGHPGWAFPVGCLTGLRFSWCTPSSLCVSLSFLGGLGGLNHSVMLKVEQLFCEIKTSDWPPLSPSEMAHVLPMESVSS